MRDEERQAPDRAPGQRETPEVHPAEMRAPRITVLGVGNTLMGDDGVGVAVVEGLPARLLGPQVEVVIGATAGMGLVKYFRTSDVVIVVDAIATQAEPGAIFRFDPDEAGIMNLRSNNIHGMGVPYLVTNARLAGADPDVVVFAVQIGDVRPHDRVLTPGVEAAVPRVREVVLEEVGTRLGKVIQVPQGRG